MNPSVQQAFEHCEALAKSHYENFPVGSLLIPKKKRPYIWSIYAFARTADDFADENYPKWRDFSNFESWREAIDAGKQERLDQLAQWERHLESCKRGEPTHPIFVALAQTLSDLPIPIQLFSDLLMAFQQDVCKRRRASFDEIIDYSRYSANPIGRLVLLVFGYNDLERFEFADALCTGLQLANFWQDIATDLEKDRLYIPQQMLRKFDISEEDLFDELALSQKRENFTSLLEELGRFTLPFFQKGARLPSLVRGRLRWELKLTGLGGMTILKRACFDPARRLLARPRITAGDKIGLLLRTLFQNPVRKEFFLAGFSNKH